MRTKLSLVLGSATADVTLASISVDPQGHRGVDVDHDPCDPYAMVPRAHVTVTAA